MRTRRDLQVAAAPAFDDDATSVDHTVIDRTRSELHSIHEATTVSKRLSFDDMPTTVWTPQPPKPGPGTSKIRVSTRRLRSVDTGPNVQVDDTTISAGPVVATDKPKVSWSHRDEVTRIEAPVPLPSTLLPTREEPTAPGVAQLRDAELRRRLPIRIAMGVVLALLAAMAFVAFQRKHAQVVSAAVARPAITALASPPPAVVAAVPPGPQVAAPAPALAPPASSAKPEPAKGEAAKTDATKAPVVVSLVPSATSDEFAAIDAVQSGNLARAARLYAALAAAHPTNDAYREAARILLEGSKESHP